MKGPTAYFLFTEENRAAIQQELNDAAAAQQRGDADRKPKSVSVAVVAKELGGRWRALPDAEKERYKELAKQRAADRAAAEEAEAGDAAAEPDAADAAAEADDQEEKQQQQQPVLPRNVAKRIMACDPEFKRASADAVWLISTAAEMMVGLLAERGAKQALSKKRKTVKLEDLQHVVKYDRRLVEAGLRDVMEDKQMYEAAAQAAASKAASKAHSKAAKATEEAAEGACAEGDGDGGAAGGSGGKQGQQQQQQRGRKKRVKEDDKAQRKLSAFFSKA